MLGLRYSPLDYNRATNSFDFGGAQLQNYLSSQVYGKTYWVCGRSGDDADNGLTLSHAFLTVGRAITEQAAHRAQIQDDYDWGDQIIIMPGTYSANLTGTLTNCTLRGIPAGLGSLSIIRSVAGHSAWHGNLSNAIVRDIEFQSNATDDSAIFLVKTIDRSTLYNVIFRSRQVGSIGLQIGGQTGGASETWEMLRDSIVSGCTFTCDTKANCLYCGINFGVYADGDSNNGQRQFLRSRITGNFIQAQKRGINLLAGNSNSQGSVIDHNIITSNLALSGPTEYGIHHCDADTMVVISDNRIKSAGDAIHGFATGNTMWNIISDGGAAATSELPTSGA